MKLEYVTARWSGPPRERPTASVGSLRVSHDSLSSSSQPRSPPPQRNSAPPRERPGTAPSAPSNGVLTMERLLQIQREENAPDVAVNLPIMQNWSEAEIRSYFAKGGKLPSTAVNPG